MQIKYSNVFNDLNLRQLNLENGFSLYNRYLNKLENISFDNIYYSGDCIVSDLLANFLVKKNSPITQISDSVYRQDAIQNEFLKITKKISWADFNTKHIVPNGKEFIKLINKLEGVAHLELNKLSQNSEISEMSVITNACKICPKGTTIFYISKLDS